MCARDENAIGPLPDEARGRKIKLKRTKMDILEELDNIQKDEVERDDLKKENNVPTI